jgi:RES domain-containing protein
VKTPPIWPYSFDGLHRLIPSKYSEGGTVLEEVAEDASMLADLVLLDGFTNERVQAELRGMPGISTYELVYGIPNAHIVNAAFAHTSQFGSRFNDNTRGAWYGAEEQQTSVREVCYHRAKHLAEIIVPGLPGTKPDRDIATYDDWLAGFRSVFHFFEPPKRYAEYLQPEPVPQCYALPQQLARQLLRAGSNGIVYPSVRRPRARCLVCFRPALVYNPHRGQRLEILFEASHGGYDWKVQNRRS